LDVHHALMLEFLSGCLLAVGLLMPTTASAQSVPETFGVASEIAYVLTAADFSPSHESDQWTTSYLPDPNTGYIQRDSVDLISWWAGLRLPAGAVVTRLEIVGCDNGAESLGFALFRSNVPRGTGFAPVIYGGTGFPETPGCGQFSALPFSPPLVIDNVNASYWVQVVTWRANISFESVRVYYELQVSTAPAVATFGDVPTTHPFFRFIEALVASGITIGCGGGNYCPDASLTRGEMAVFLSKALGLHFAP
jgi:hypothetical protein